MQPARILLLTALWGLLPALVVGAERAAALPDANRRQFEEWRKHPEHLERLRKDAKVFADLPDDQRQRILHLGIPAPASESANGERIADICPNAHVWEEGIALEDDSEISSLRR